MTKMMVKVKDLRKRFGKKEILRGIDFSATAGSVLGVLGRNGAGKSTTINCLTTLLKPDGGSATIAGYDVLTEPTAVRALIGLTGQFAAIDEELTAQENLVLFGQLLRLSARQAKYRAHELLERFELQQAAHKRVKEFSGGMRRRLDLAVSIITEPLVLFLDEPTTGLDPKSRRQVWNLVGELKERGMTIILTTQYLEEADELANAIVVIDRGQVIARGTADELKNRVGKSFCELKLANPNDEPKVRQELTDFGEILSNGNTLTLVASRGVTTLVEVSKRLNDLGLILTEISLRRPSLDDVFFALIGHTTRESKTKW